MFNNVDGMAYFVIFGPIRSPYLRQVMELFAAAKKHGFAIPAVNVTSSSTANACMEAAASINSPIILQVIMPVVYEFLIRNITAKHVLPPRARNKKKRLPLKLL